MSDVFHSQIASIEQLEAKIDTLKQAYSGLKENVKTSAKEMLEDTKKLSKGKEAEAKALSEVVKKATMLSAAYKDLTEEEKKMEKEVKDQIKAQQALQKQKDRYLAQMAKEEHKLREAGKWMTKNARNMEELKKKGSALRLMMDKADFGSKRFKQLQTELEKTNAKLKQFDKNVGQNQRNVGNYTGAIQKVGKAYIATAAAITGVVMIGRSVARMFSSSIEAAGMQEKAERKLTTALGYQSQALLNLAAARQKATTFGDEATIEAMAYLSMMGLQEQEIKKLIPLIQDLAAAKSMDLVTAADMVAKSVGSSTNALKRYGVDIEGAVGSSERLESAITSLTKQVGGQAEAIATVGVGAIEQFSNSWGDLQEKLGQSVLPTINKVIGALGRMFASDEEKEILDLQNQIEINLKAIKRVEEDNLPLQERSVRVWKEAVVADTARLDILKQRMKLQEIEIDIASMRASAQAKIDKYMDNLHAKQKADREQQAKDDEAAAKERERLIEQEAKAKIAADKKYMAQIYKRADEQAKLYEKVIKEQEKIEADAWTLSKELGFATQDEIYAYEMEKVLSSAEYRLLIEGKTADEIVAIRAAISERAKKAAAGGATDLPSEPDAFGEMGDMPDFTGGATLGEDLQSAEEQWSEYFNTVASYAQTFGSIMNDIIGAVYDFQIQAIENNLEESEAAQEEELAAIEDKYNRGLISEQEYTQGKTAIEAKYNQEQEKLKKEKAEKEKEQAIISAIINTAVAVTSALGAGPGIGIALAIITAALGAIEIATIASQQFAEGGLLKIGKEGKVMKGARHSGGGISMANVEVEDGEHVGIISRAMSNKYKNEIPLIFDSLNEGRFEQLFQPSIISESKYTKKLYEHMVSKKDRTTRTEGQYTVIQEGNQTIRIKASKS